MVGVWAVRVTPTSPAVVTVPDAVDELFEVVGSAGELDVTDAVLVISVPVDVAAAIVPVAVTVKLAPLARVATVQLTLGAGLQVPAVVVTFVTVTPDGTVSDNVRPFA